MKKIYVLTLILWGFIIQAQEKQSRYYNAWRFGLNIGGMWQTADVRSTAGVAGGFTLEKGILENKTNFFSLAIRGRGLFGNTYGMDASRNYDVKNNPALNGTYNPSIRYDTVSGNPFIYNNYKTQINEGALELQISFNRLRERTNVLLNLWGGVGITGYRANINLLDGNNKMYNYSKVDSAGGASSILASHRDILDGSYESYAKGSKANNLITFSPSCGIGLGYKFNDYISLIYEYKLTFPQGSSSDLLDGIIGKNNDQIAGSKDYYHYTGLTFSFKVGGGKGKKSSTTNLENYTSTNTVVSIPNNSVVPNTNITQPVVVPKPIVNINNPPTSPYNETANSSFTVLSKVYNVNKRPEVYITFNGTEVKNYTWIGKSISFVVPLSIGNNVVVITATNSAGSDSKSATINYSGVPPQITITTPGTNQHIATQSLQDLYATVLNVESASYINVKFNNVPFNSFAYNPANNVLSMQLSLLKGSNSVEITATNKFGSDIKTQIITYNPVINTIGTPTGTASRPVTVVILDPAANPIKSPTQNYFVKSKVTGVTSSSQVVVLFNNVLQPFNYDNGSVTFNVNLLSGNNTVSVSANNGKSSDSKSTVIIWETVKKSPSKVICHRKDRVNFETITIAESEWPAHQAHGDYEGACAADPDITICHNKQTITIKQNEWPAHQAHGDQMGECPKLQSGEVGLDPDITICHNKQTITIKQSQWPAHQAHGDQMGECPKLQSGEVGLDPDITICHNKQTITIKQSQWAAHQAHGDQMGACPKLQSGEVGLDPDITICHNENGSKQTITIKQSQWPNHQAHGDQMGACPKLGGPGTEVGLDPDITICHNQNGNKQTITIKQSQWAAHQAHGDQMGACPKLEGPGTEVGIDPDITICHKNGDGTETKMTIKQSQWPAHQAHGDYLGGNCTSVTNATISTGGTMEICHKNADGSYVTIVIAISEWAVHKAHGDVMGKCAVTPTVVPTEKKITICHIPPGNTGNPQTIEIPESAWPAHEAHGDTKGACIVQEKKITICHIPPGNSGNPQTIEISESAWPAHEAHGDAKGTCVVQEKKITICHIPPGNSGNPQTIEISESAWPAHEAHGDTKGACVVQPEDKKITICHIPPGNSGNPQTIEINESAWPAHAAHGDTKGACVVQEKKITICHIPPGNSGNPQTIEIPESAWPAHQAHGDTKGTCVVQEKKITICHIPPGNTGNPQTIEISESAWPAHEAHGDTKGACAPANNNPGNGNNNPGGGKDKKIKICHIPPGNTGNPQTIEIPESAWPAHEAHGDTKGECDQSKKLKPEGEGNPGDGSNTPGRTNQTQTKEPEKTEGQPKTLRPR